MKLNLIDKLTLLALDDNTGENIADSISYQHAVAGALLLELALNNKIKIEDNKLIITELSFTKNKILDDCIKIIHKYEGKDEFGDLIQLIADKTDSINSETIDKLVSSGILEHKENKILWVFTNSSFPSVNDNPETEIRTKLINIIESKEDALLEDIMLISLLDSCGLNVEVFGNDRAEKYEDRIKELIANSEMSSLINSKIKEIHDILVMVITGVLF